MRRICVVTGSRSEYGIVRPIMRAIDASPALGLQLVVAGMHLASEFGRSEELIAKDGFTVHARVDMLFSGDTTGAMAKGLGVGVYGFTQSLEILRPDVVLVQGDRVEAFAAALAAGFLQIPIAHTHGGDVSRGGFDEYMRHAITRFAHLHFAATEASRKRILALGEREEYTFTVGSPGLDELATMPLMSRAELSRAVGLPESGPYLLVVQHSVSTQAAEAAWQMRETLEAIRDVALPAVVVYPNSDAGSRSLIEAIGEYEQLPGLRIVRNLERPQYLSLLASSAALVGNSSSGMWESPWFKVPVVDIGIRQEGRECSTNVLRVTHDRAAIAGAIRTALSPAYRAQARPCENPYGDGRASERIVRLLTDVELGPVLLDKGYGA